MKGLEERDWWWLWSRCPGLGAVRLSALQSLATQDPAGLAGLWSWPLPRLQCALRWSDSLTQRVDAYRRRWGVSPDVVAPDSVLIPGDANWPLALADLERLPMVLHWRGDAALLRMVSARQAVAIVGTRRPSSHGLRMAEALGEALARAGWPVVSGLAEGVDAAAHQGCLKAGGAPIGVVGTPLSRVYPPEHERLQVAVASQGLLLSEHGPEARVSRASFALRNRLLVALADWVVVVECPEGSGAMISAEIALAMERSLWVVPGDALRQSSCGSNRLLTCGACPLLSIASFLTALGPGPCADGAQAPAAGRGGGSHAPQLQDAPLLRLLEEGAGLDRLARDLGRPTGVLAEQLLQLELQGLVKAEAGMRWRLV